MITIDVIRHLNRLLAIHCRSFIQYLRWARPHVSPGHEEEIDALTAIADDQDGMAERITRLIIDAGALPHSGEFPMEFTDLHDLDIDFLVSAAVKYQEFDLTAIQKIVDGLAAAPAARAIAEESLGMSKGHLDSLRELIEVPTVNL
jgi:bacterioferritin (cytochrome b1)